MWLKVKMLLLVLCFCFVPAIMVYASDIPAEELPEVKSWEDGYGYDAEGNMITNGWAYDTIHIAGKYVLFGEDGAVIRKADDWDSRDRIEEFYTSTELDTATIALRTEIFTGFKGNISVILQEKSGVRKSVTLSQDNLYELNVPVNSGDYSIQKAEASDDKYLYETEFSPAQYQIEERGILILKIMVTDNKTGKVGQDTDNNVEDSEGDHTESEFEGERSQKGQKQKEEFMVIETGVRKYMFVLGGIAAGILAVYLLLRNRRNKYD